MSSRGVLGLLQNLFYNLIYYGNLSTLTIIGLESTMVQKHFEK